MAKNDLEQSRRNQILEAAEKVFAERGIDKTRMDDIVRASGLSKGALYWYYRSKDAIIHALVDRFFGGEIRRTERLVESEGSATERIRRFLKNIIGEIRRIELLLPLGYEFFAMAARSPSARQSLQKYYSQYIQLLAKMIQQGIDAGEFRQMDPVEVALAISALFEGLALFWFLDPASVDWDRMEKVAFTILIRGIQPQEA
jgi:AcrR family transcriptional regulator